LASFEDVRTLEQSFGRYRLLERLGEGGMAEVFKAKSFGVEGFEKVLVIKRILPKLAEHPKFVDMFVHEAKLAVRLSHANIVQVFDLGRVDHPTGEPTSYFIAMEYVPGLDLASVLTRCRRQKRDVPLGMAVFVAAEMAKALDHAHRRRDEQSRPLGIVHRDISPQNVLVSWEGEVKVTDFGIAKAIDSIVDESRDEAQGRVRGKLAYMSPEQSRAQPVDGRSDIFSLGTVLYEMLTGTNPFTAPTSFETLRRVQASEYPPMELYRPDVPKGVADIVGKMLARDPKDRFSDAGRLHDELLGYFYAAAERFGANDLTEFLMPFRDTSSAPELGASVFEEEHVAANERTPVEVPRGNTNEARTGSLLAPTPARGEAAVAPLRTPELGQRREVTALVLCFGAERERQATPESADTQAVLVRARRVLLRYGGTVIETDGTQITALFGLADADGRDTEAAVRAALVIQRARLGGSTVGAGVHVARIVVDAQGEPVRDERLASLVATAQMLARAADHAVCVSQLAARIVRQAFTTEEMSVSGRAIPDGGRLVSSARPPSQMYGRFIGRTEELRKLGDILAAATRRRAQVAVVSGDKGIGKTRLIAEMERRLLKGSYNVGFYTASCPRNGSEAPWSGITAMLHVLCGIQEGDDEAKIRDVLPRLRALGLQDDECSAVLHQLGATVAEEHSNRRGEGSTSALLTTASLKSAFGRMAQGLCDDRLHVFAWDDAQSIDRTTLETIVATAGRTPGLRAVFLLAVREVADDAGDGPVVKKATVLEAIAGHPHTHQIDLGQLSDDDTAKFVSSRVNAKIVPPELLGFCRERAGGHPLFLEELLKELVDSGAVSTVSGGLRLRLDGAMAVPRSLRALIAARVARLPPELRVVMQGAAILGAPVPTAALAALLGQKVVQIDRAVAQLAAKDLLRATGPAQADFASPTHGEIVLDLLPPEGRRELHAASAVAYAAVVGEDGVEHAERIAGHLYEAGDRDRAATFFARAGMHKVRLSQLEPAIALLSRALDLADLDRRSATELSQWLGALASAVFHVRRAPEIIDLARRALERIDAAGALEERVAARVDIARALGSANLFEECYRRLDEAFELSADRDELRDLRRRALLIEAESAVRGGDFTRGLRAVDKIEAMGPVEDERLLLVIAFVRATMSDLPAALRALDRAEALADPGDLVAACARAKMRALVHLYCRDLKAGIEAALLAVQIARSTNLRYDIAATLHNLGEAARRLGDLRRAYAALTESLEVARSAGIERLISLNRIHLAYLDGMNGVTGAEALLRDLVRYANAYGYWTDALEGRYLLGALLKHRGVVEEAKRELEEVMSLAAAKGNHLIFEDAREVLSEIE
jgi:serine/threonine protein kinase/tetratricopeptide (TPR) repeat protein